MEKNSEKKREIENDSTRKQLDDAQRKFNDPKYVKFDTTHTYPEKHGTCCRLWIRCVDGGYPKITIGNVPIGAHIVACTIGNDYVRLKNLEAAHDCGQVLCVNSEHLTFKSHKENVADKFDHGTQPFKLSFEQVADIREQYANGEIGVFLAESYGVHKVTIYDIANMKTRTKR